MKTGVKEIWIVLEKCGTNIYLYSWIYSDIHSSNIYDSEYISIFIVPRKWLFWTNIFISQNIRRYFVGEIYSYIYLWSFYPAEYIQILIHWISMVTNIFRYSFVQKNYICPTLYWKKPAAQAAGADPFQCNSTDRQNQPKDFLQPFLGLGSFQRKLFVSLFLW